jgi:hypothetical protein
MRCDRDSQLKCNARHSNCSVRKVEVVVAEPAGQGALRREVLVAGILVTEELAGVVTTKNHMGKFVWVTTANHKEPPLKVRE